MDERVTSNLPLEWKTKGLPNAITRASEYIPVLEDGEDELYKHGIFWKMLKYEDASLANKEFTLQMTLGNKHQLKVMSINSVVLLLAISGGLCPNLTDIKQPTERLLFINQTYR